MPIKPVRVVLGAVVTAAVFAASAVVAAPAAHAVDLDCGDFSSQREAQLFFLDNGGPDSDPHRLDADGDGIACESNPGPYYEGTTPPSNGGGSGDQPTPEPEPAPVTVRSTVRMTVSPAQRIAGERFRVDISVRPRISRDVILQRRVDGRWRTFGTGTTGTYGTTHGYFRSAAVSQTYRAVLRPATSGRTRYTAAGSEPRTVRATRQQVSLQIADRTIDEGRRVGAVVKATPVRAGRPVVVQVWRGGQWRTIDKRAVDRRGVARFSLAPNVGRSLFRAVVLRSRGAASKGSRTVSVVAADRTPPAAPYGLASEVVDGSVNLSWSRTFSADFDHHEILLQTGNSPWQVVDTTTSTTTTLTNLQAGQTYLLAVMSVDTSGNRSVPSETVSVVL